MDIATIEWAFLVSHVLLRMLEHAVGEVDLVDRLLILASEVLLHACQEGLGEEEA